jgi:hypothetical protein
VADFDWKIAGQVAGIGGIAIGAMVFVLRDLIRKLLLPTMDRRRAFWIVMSIVGAVWSVALAGIAGWVFAPRDANSQTNECAPGATVNSGGTIICQQETRSSTISKLNAAIDSLGVVSASQSLVLMSDCEKYLRDSSSETTDQKTIWRQFRYTVQNQLTRVEHATDAVLEYEGSLLVRGGYSALSQFNELLKARSNLLVNMRSLAEEPPPDKAVIEAFCDRYDPLAEQLRSELRKLRSQIAAR